MDMIFCNHFNNPFSKSQFKTQKYQPDYPGRFDSVAHARRWREAYFDWYNNKHHHSGLAGFTPPEQVFTGRFHDVAKQKQRALGERFQQNPERFSQGPPKVKMPPEFVAINPLTIDDSSHAVISDCINFTTLSAAGYVSGK